MEKLSSAAKVKFWEEHQICAPQAASEPKATRCKIFHDNCHDCLTAFAVNQEFRKILHQTQNADKTM